MNATTHPGGTGLPSQHTATANYYQATYFSIHTFQQREASLSVCHPQGGIRLRLEARQTMFPQDPDPDLTVAEVGPVASAPT